MNLSKNVSIREVGAPVANALDTDSNSDRIDMSGWEGILFVCPITDCADTGVATLKVEQNSIDSDTGMTALTGASAAKTSAANDDLNDKLLVVDVVRPTKRYVQAVRTSTVANIAFGNVIAILYRGKLAPTATDASVLTAALAVEPAEV